MPHESVEISQSSPFIQNPAREDWQSLTVGCDHTRTQIQNAVSQSLSEQDTHQVPQHTLDIPQPIVYATHLSDIQETDALYDADVYDENFHEECADQPMFSMKEDDLDPLPLYCQYVKGILQTVYPPKIRVHEHLTTSSEL